MESISPSKQAELKETEAEHEADIALREALMGNEREAQEQANIPMISLLRPPARFR
jgi:hypothetical protein